MQGSHEQSTSYQIELDQEATSTAFFWSLLRKHFPPAVVEAVTSLRMQADRRTAVFELKSEHCQTVEETAQSLRTQNVFITRTKYSPGPQAVANGHTYQKPNGYKKNTENGFKKNFG